MEHLIKKEWFYLLPQNTAEARDIIIRENKMRIVNCINSSQQYPLWTPLVKAIISWRRDAGSSLGFFERLPTSSLREVSFFFSFPKAKSTYLSLWYDHIVGYIIANRNSANMMKNILSVNHGNFATDKLLAPPEMITLHIVSACQKKIASWATFCNLLLSRSSCLKLSSYCSSVTSAAAVQDRKYLAWR